MANQKPDFSEFDNSVPRLKKAVMGRTERGIAKSVLHLLGVAAEDAPLDEGTLRGSGSALVNGKAIGTSAGQGKGGSPATTDNIVSRLLKFGQTYGVVGFNTPYASRQDQDNDLEHPKGGKAGYLTDNAKKYQKVYAKWIGEELGK